MVHKFLHATIDQKQSEKSNQNDSVIVCSIKLSRLDFGSMFRQSDFDMLPVITVAARGGMRLAKSNAEISSTRCAE
jgi:hypothetical protein